MLPSRDTSPYSNTAILSIHAFSFLTYSFYTYAYSGFFWLKRPLYSLIFQSALFFPSQEEYKSTRHQCHVFTKAWSLNCIFSWIPSKLMCIHGLEAVFLLPETIATAHIKCCTVLLAWSLSYVSIHQTLVCNTRKIKPSPSGLREHIAGKDAPVLLLSVCWSYSPRLALTRQVVLNIFLAQTCLCVGGFSSRTYFYLPIYHTTKPWTKPVITQNLGVHLTEQWGIPCTPVSHSITIPQQRAFFTFCFTSA